MLLTRQVTWSLFLRWVFRIRRSDFVRKITTFPIWNNNIITNFICAVNVNCSVLMTLNFLPSDSAGLSDFGIGRVIWSYRLFIECRSLNCFNPKNIMPDIVKPLSCSILIPIVSRVSMIEPNAITLRMVLTMSGSSADLSKSTTPNASSKGFL